MKFAQVCTIRLPNRLLFQSRYVDRAPEPNERFGASIMGLACDRCVHEAIRVQSANLIGELPLAACRSTPRGRHASSARSSAGCSRTGPRAFGKKKLNARLSG